MKKSYLFMIVLVLVIMYGYRGSSSEFYEVEDTKLLGAPSTKRTYAEFVKIAEMLQYDAPISIPWIHIENVDDFLPTYLKYKEKILLPITNQGDCAACWSMGVTHMISDRISIYTNGRIKKLLSAQEMISCWDKSIKNDIGCKTGGVPELAYQYIIKHGIALEKEYPYQQQNTTKIFKCDRNKMKHERVYIEPNSVRSLCRNPEQYKNDKQKYKAIIDENILNMKKEIFVNGEIVGTIMVYENLYTYDGLSIYSKKKGKFIGGHLVNIIGWSESGVNTSEPGFDGAYWIAKNFWSTEWPTKSPSSNGYFYIKMGENVCGIESRASRAFPVLTNEIKSTMVKDLRDSRYESITEYVDDPERENYISKVGAMKKWF